MDSSCSVNLADMQLTSNYRKRIRFLLCAMDVSSKYRWVIPLKYRKTETITKTFQKILDYSGRTPRNIWVSKGRNVYNRCKTIIKFCLIHNEEKSVVEKGFIGTLKKKIKEYMAP